MQGVERPNRKAIPDSIKRIVVDRQNGLCTCGCGDAVEWKAHRNSTRFDHFPAIFLRTLDATAADYEPYQLDPAYIVARCLDSDARKTHGGKRGTTAGSDVNAIAKQRARDRKPKPKQKIPSRPFQSGKSQWPKGRKMQSRKLGAKR